jgi:hypothetical protein
MRLTKEIVKQNAAAFIEQQEFWNKIGLYPHGYNSSTLADSYGTDWDGDKLVKLPEIWLCVGKRRGESIFMLGRNFIEFSGMEEEVKKYEPVRAEIEKHLRELAASPALLEMFDKAEDHFNYYSFETVLSVDGDYDKIEYVYEDVEEIRLHVKSLKVTARKRRYANNPYVRFNMD